MDKGNVLDESINGIGFYFVFVSGIITSIASVEVDGREVASRF